MAKPVTARGRQMLIKLGDGGSPETFAAPCAMTSRGLSRSKEVNGSTTPDCDSPDATPWSDQEPVSKGWEISGAGKVAKAHLSIWDAFFEDDEPKNIQVDVKFLDSSIRRYAGAAFLTAFNVTGEDGDFVTFEATLTGHGALTGADVP